LGLDGRKEVGEMANRYAENVDQLIEELSAVVERGGYNFNEAMGALSQLSEHYMQIAQYFSGNADMKKIASFFQENFEKSAGARNENAVAEITK